MILAALITCMVAAEPMPSWVLPGIAAIETRSYQDPDGTWHYVDQRDGKDREIGMCQMVIGTFRLIRRQMPRGTTFADLRSPIVAVEAARLYLEWLYERTHSWDYAVMCYNVGLRGRLVNAERAELYLARVKRAGGFL